MKIIVTAAAAHIDGAIEPRFGRCPYLILVDSETDEHQAIANQSAASAGGAGIATARKIVELGAQVVITGRIGPNGQEVLTQAGVEMITGCAGPIREILKNYRAGELEVGAAVTGRPQGRQAVAQGMERGRGMGGKGRGMGGGGGGMRQGSGAGQGRSGATGQGGKKGQGRGGGGKGRGRA